MRRLQVFEFEDFRWFPAVLRDAMTDHLAMLGELGRHGHEPFAARLKEAMAACDEHRIVDLCSGGGGPAATIVGLLGDPAQRPVELTLTDFFPNLDRFERLRSRSTGHVRYASDPVDATAVPRSLEGFRLVCNAFHHFPPAQARAILRDAVEQRRGIAIYEALDPTLAGFLMPVFIALSMFVLTPLMRPFRLSRLLLTYLVPAAPLFLLWDGFMSWLRIYGEGDLRELIASLGADAERYTWEIGRLPVPGSPGRTTYLIGTPRVAS